MKLLLKLLSMTVAVFAAAYIIPGVSVSSFWIAGLVAIVVGLLNVFVKPLISFLALPITFLTLGLFNFVINALIIWLAAYIIPDFSVENFWIAILFAFVVSIFSSFLNAFVD